jgi:hypothetical protein
MPAQVAYRYNSPEVHTQPLPSPEYIRGPSALYRDDALDIGGVAVEEIVHVLSR